MRTSKFVPRFAALCLAATASAAYAQNAIPLFSPVNTRYSLANTSPSNLNDFNSTILNLMCTAPITAKLSSTADGTGNVLVDNFITVNTGQGPQEACAAGDTQPSCFNDNWYSTGQFEIGVDPDTLTATEGIPPIDISSLLSPGTIQATISLQDNGVVFASSSLYLVTSCTSLGVTGPAQITGNPIPQSNPSSSQLSQSAAFNSGANQNVQFTYNLNEAQNNGNLSIVNGTVPITNDLPINPANFSSTYLSGTSFATATCLIHTGELYNGSPGCKLYTLTCQQGINPGQAGALCPTSTQRDEIFQESFDGPAFTLTDHQGVGLLEASDNWSGSSCEFDPASGQGSLLCPQNLLTTFSGPGIYSSGGRSQNPNSTFISVAPVLEPVTTFTVANLQPGNWVNTHTPTVNFTVTAPTASGNNFIAAPIQSLTFGTSSPSDVPPPDPPVATDTVITNTVACPAPGPQNPGTPPPFSVPVQTIPDISSDGNYVVHYLAQDCAGTEELKFTNSGGSWSTSFYTFPINVDTVAPQVASGPTLSPAPPSNGAYPVGAKVTASYSCTDDRSGVVNCGASTFSPGTLNTGTITTTLDTSKAGPQSFTVNVVDAAGNVGTPVTVNYTVTALPAANLSIAKLAPASAKQGSQLVYAIAAADIGKQAATSVVITDPLPAGVTFVNASALQLVCTNGKCSNQASCSFANNTVTCTAPSMTLLTPVAVAITVKVTATSGTKIKNTATVSSANPEGSGNTTSSATTTVTK
jgi:uncharacterized repeat protein (TIGR01451 family)